MTADQFYSGKRLLRTLWYVEVPGGSLGVNWARLRVFDDGTADACMEPEGVAYGFANEGEASHLLSEDEFRRSDLLDAEDAREYAIDLAQTQPPTWPERSNGGFRYLGSYP